MEVIKVNEVLRGESSSNRIGAFIRRGRGNEGMRSLPLSTEAMRGHSEKAATCKPGKEPSPDSESANTLVLDFQPPEL